MSDKMIRFVDTHYKELFTVPDGGFIQISQSNCESKIRQCHYEDPMHVKVGSHFYHIHELALAVEHARATIAPVEQEVVHGYTITDRAVVGDKTIVMAHNPNAVSPYVTWQQLKGREGYDLGHYYSNHRDADTDFTLRTNAERSGVSHTPFMPSQKSHDNAR